jgi:hypothetical protein
VTKSEAICRKKSLPRMIVRRTRILLLLAVVAAGCSRSPHAAARSPVVVISVDTLRADHLPVYGYRGVRTPAIDAIARDSSVFENAYSNVPLTLPSHASLLTGLLPFENGVRDNIGFRLAPAHRTLATLLRSASYATGAAVSSYDAEIAAAAAARRLFIRVWIWAGAISPHWPMRATTTSTLRVRSCTTWLRLRLRT